MKFGIFISPDRRSLIVASRQADFSSPGHSTKATQTDESELIFDTNDILSNL